MRNRGAELSIQDTAAAFAIDCMLRVVSCGAQLHAGDATAGLDWSTFERAFLLNAIPSTVKTIRLPSGKPLHKTKREGIVTRAYRLLGAISARKDRPTAVVPRLDPKQVIEMLTKQCLGTTTYSPLLYLRGIGGLVVEDASLLSNEVLQAILRVSLPAHSTSKSQTAAARRAAEACVDCLYLARDALPNVAEVHLPAMTRAVATCIAGTETRSAERVGAVLSSLASKIPGSVMLTMIGVPAPSEIPSAFKDSVSSLQGSTLLGVAAGAPKVAKQLLELILSLLAFGSDFKGVGVGFSSSSREMLASADATTRGKALQEILGEVETAFAQPGGENESESANPMRSALMQCLFELVSSRTTLWKDVELEETTSLSSELLRALQAGGSSILPGLAGCVISMMRQLMPVRTSIDSQGLQPSGGGAQASESWLRYFAASLGCMACRTSSNTVPIGHGLVGSESFADIEVDPGVSQVSASIFEGDDASRSATNALDPAAVASLLPQGTTGTRSTSRASLCSFGS